MKFMRSGDKRVTLPIRSVIVIVIEIDQHAFNVHDRVSVFNCCVSERVRRVLFPQPRVHSTCLASQQVNMFNKFNMFSKSMSTSASITQCVSALYISLSTNYLMKSCSLSNSEAAESLIDVHHISQALQIPPSSTCFNMSRNEQIFFIPDGQLKQEKVDVTFFSLHRLFFSWSN